MHITIVPKDERYLTWETEEHLIIQSLVKRLNTTGAADIFFSNPNYKPPALLKTPRTTDFSILNTSSHNSEKKPFWKIPYLLLDGDLKYFCRWGKSKFQQTQSLYIYKKNLELEASKKTGGTNDIYTFSNEKNTLSIQWTRSNPSLDLEIIPLVPTHTRSIEIDLTDDVNQLAIELPTPMKTPPRTFSTSTPKNNNTTFKTPGSPFSSIHTS